MSEKEYYPTKADIVVKDVNISSATGQHLSEVIGLWQFLTWDECLKVLQLMRSARKRNWEAKKEKEIKEKTVTPSDHDLNW